MINLMHLVSAKIGFPGKCQGEMCGEEWSWWLWAGRGWVKCPGKGAVFVLPGEMCPEIPKELWSLATNIHKLYGVYCSLKAYSTLALLPLLKKHPTHANDLYQLSPIKI